VATAVASVLSTSILFGAVKRKMMEWRRLELLEQGKIQTESLTTVYINGSAGNASVSTSETVSGKAPNDAVALSRNDGDELKDVPLLSLPDRESFIDLLKLSGPIFFNLLAKIACYGAMTLRCTEFGVIPLATHNIMMRVFFFYGTFGDAISQTAQTYLPATLYPKPNPRNFRKIFKRLLLMTTVLGVVNSQACVGILKYGGQFLASDPGIVSLMKVNTRYLGIAVLLHPFILLCEGVVIASRDFKTLVIAYAITLGMHFSILNFFSNSFPAVWRTFFFFQMIRVWAFSLQVWRKQVAIRKSEAAAAIAKASA
jgi:Na+-driven multidrug efflux pump